MKLLSIVIIALTACLYLPARGATTVDLTPPPSLVVSNSFALVGYQDIFGVMGTNTVSWSVNQPVELTWNAYPEKYILLWGRGTNLNHSIALGCCSNYLFSNSVPVPLGPLVTTVSAIGDVWIESAASPSGPWTPMATNAPVRLTNAPGSLFYRACMPNLEVAISASNLPLMAAVPPMPAVHPEPVAAAWPPLGTMGYAWPN
jgi:hypothetical protein